MVLTTMPGPDPEFLPAMADVGLCSCILTPPLFFSSCCYLASPEGIGQVASDSLLVRRGPFMQREPRSFVFSVLVPEMLRQERVEAREWSHRALDLSFEQAASK